MVSKKNEASPVELLSIFKSGVLAVTVNGKPFIKVDAESQSVQSEVSGIRESGIKLGSIITPENPNPNLLSLLKASRTTAKELDEQGWKFELYDKGKNILSMGRGVSKLTGRIHISPTKLRTIRDTVE